MKIKHGNFTIRLISHTKLNQPVSESEPQSLLGVVVRPLIFPICKTGQEELYTKWIGTISNDFHVMVSMTATRTDLPIATSFCPVLDLHQVARV